MNSTNATETNFTLIGLSKDGALTKALSWVTLGVSAGTVLSNCLVLLLFVIHRPLRTCTNALVASLTVADLVFGATLLVNNMWREELLQWTPSCIFIYTVIPWSSVASPWSLLAITVDRYIFVRLPLVYCRKVGRRTVGAAIAAVWTLSLSFSISGLIPWPERPDTRLLCGGVVTRNLPFLCVYLVLVVIPCISVAVLYSLILKVARRSNKLHQELLLLVPATGSKDHIPETRDHEHVGVDGDSKGDSSKEKHVAASPKKCRRIAKSTKMFFYLTLIFFVLWLPMNVTMSILLFCESCKYNVTLLFLVRVSVMLYVFTPMINPWLYTLRNRDFRMALKVLVHRKREVVENNSSLMSRNSIDTNMILR